MAQEQYIEVEVSDNIICPIDGINYSINGPAVEATEKALIQYFEKQGLRFKKGKLDSASMLSFVVTFQSWNEVEAFKKEFDGSEHAIISQILGPVHEIRGNEIDKLYRKILATGRKEANQIAKAMDKEIDELVLVKYIPKNEQIGGWTAYPPLSALNKSSIAIPETKSETMEKSRSLFLKFKVK